MAMLNGNCLRLPILWALAIVAEKLLTAPYHLCKAQSPRTPPNGNGKSLCREKRSLSTQTWIVRPDVSMSLPNSTCTFSIWLVITSRNLLIVELSTPSKR